MDKWKAQVQKSDEVGMMHFCAYYAIHWGHQLVSNFEQNLSCQICMDLITQPHGFVPVDCIVVT